MKEIRMRKFQCTKDFNGVNDFLSDTFKLYGKNYNWDNGRWAFNRFCIHSKEELSNNRSWEDSVAIWENQDSEIVGVAHIEEPGDYFLQVHPDYKYLEEEMLLWAMRNCKQYTPKLCKLSITCSCDDNIRKDLLKRYSGVKCDFVDDHRLMVLEKKLATHMLPEGYNIIQIDPSDQEVCDNISWLYSHIWPSSSYISTGSTVSLFKHSRAFLKEGSYALVDPQGIYVAFTILWSDSEGRIGHFYPIGINPDYINIETTKTLISHCINKLLDEGFEKLTISAWYTEVEEKAFAELGFVKTDSDEIYEINLYD